MLRRQSLLLPKEELSDLHFKMRDKPYQANRTISVMAKIFKLAEAWEMTPPRRNSCRSMRRYKEHRRERFLSPEKYGRPGRVLAVAETSGRFLPSGIAVIRLLVLTGCRKNEIVTRRLDDIDRTAGEIWLRDSKTGARRIPLTPLVERVLADIPVSRATPGSFRGRTRATICRTSTRSGSSSGRAPGSTMCASTTPAIPTRPGRWRSANPFR